MYNNDLQYAAPKMNADAKILSNVVTDLEEFVTRIRKYNRRMKTKNLPLKVMSSSVKVMIVSSRNLNLSMHRYLTFFPL